MDSAGAGSSLSVFCHELRYGVLYAAMLSEKNGKTDRELLAGLRSIWRSLLHRGPAAPALKEKQRVDQQKLRSRRTFVINGAVCMALILGIGIYGIVNARIVHTTPYEITIDKDGGNFQDMKVVLVADLHLGYNIGVSQITKMVDKINAEDPDLVVIAGDIFDNEYEALEDPDALIALIPADSEPLWNLCLLWQS